MQSFETMESKETERKVSSFKTARGSVYSYDESGRTTRYKTATGEQMVTQDITVFVKLTVQEEQDYLDPHAVNGAKTRILEVVKGAETKNINDINEATSPEDIYLCIIDEDGHVVAHNKASLDPVIGYDVFDMRHFYDSDGNYMAERHLGNQVTEITYE